MQRSVISPDQDSLSNSATVPLSPSPLNPSVSSDGDKDSCRPGAAGRRPIVALVYSMIPLVSRFDLLHRRLILRFEFAVQLEVLIESTGAWHRSRGLRSVVEEVLEEVLFVAEAGVRYVITDKTVRGGEAVKQSVSQTRAPLSYHLLRRFRVSKTVESSGLRRG